MSVVYSKRNKSKSDKEKNEALQILSLSGEIVDYTLKTVTNEKHFPKRYRWCLAYKILDKAIMIDDYLNLANAIYVRPDDGSKIRRLSYIQRALEITYPLLKNIERANYRFGQGSFNIEFWTSQIEELQRRIRGWYKTESERYKDIK